MDGPVVEFVSGDTEHGVEHVFLTDVEGVDVDDLILEILQTSFGVATFRLSRQAQECGHCTTNLRPSGRRDLGLTIVEECSRFAWKIEAKRWRNRKRPFVPESCAERDIAADARRSDLFVAFRHFRKARDVVDDTFNGGIAAPVVGENIWHAGLGCSANEFALSVIWGEDAESDEQDFLATESVYQSGVIIVRGFDDLDAGRKLAGAVRAGNCGEVEATSLQKRLGDEAAASSTSL